VPKSRESFAAPHATLAGQRCRRMPRHSARVRAYMVRRLRDHRPRGWPPRVGPVAPSWILPSARPPTRVRSYAQTFIAAHRGFAEMERLGFIPKWPLMAAAQAAWPVRPRTKRSSRPRRCWRGPSGSGRDRRAHSARPSSRLPFSQKGRVRGDSEIPSRSLTIVLRSTAVWKVSASRTHRHIAAPVPERASRGNPSFLFRNPANAQECCPLWH
jgi:hypothetical protein